MDKMTELINALAGKVIVITGASGYIGSALTRELKKYSVKIIRISRKELSPKPGVEDWVLDLNKNDSWKRIVTQADIIFHLAGNTSIYSAEQDPEESLTSTLFPINRLISVSKELCRVPRVVFASTATVYGLTEILPTTEETRPNPITIYDLHKLFVEQQLSMASQNNVISAISLRLANVYGPSLSESKSDDRGVLSKVTRIRLEGGNIQAYGKGNYFRDYIYIDDVVNAFLHASVINNAESIVNVASGIGTIVKDVFSIISSEVEIKTGVSGDVEDVEWPKGVNAIEKRNFIASVELLKSLSGWSPSISLEEGIRRLVAHYN